MKQLRLSSLLAISALASACSGPAVEELPVTSSTSAIVFGSPSTEEEDYVVDLVGGGASCTGTLLAPNVVLTALHCVSDYEENARFSCDTQGRLTSVSPGGGVIGDVLRAESIAVRVGPASSMDDPAAHGVKIFAADTASICLNDIAVLVIDADLEPPPQMVRRSAPTRVREVLTAVGYGQDENGTVRVRNRRTGLRVAGVGEYGQFEAAGNPAPPRTFTVGQGPCHGDSGGPAFSEATGAIVGVYSAVYSECTSPTVRNVFTQVAAFGSLIDEAMEFAGAELLVEPPQVEPMGGASGASGAAGAGDTGGSVTSGGGGAGGRGAAAGSSSTEAGTDSSGAGTAGRRSGSGTGSREDPTCACRTVGQSSSDGRAWLALLGLLGGAVIRRRRASK